MARLRHPNVVLFMGAVMQAHQLAIVTQFIPRGSLFRLLHRSKADLDPRRRLQMALDIARGGRAAAGDTMHGVRRDLHTERSRLGIWRLCWVVVCRVLLMHVAVVVNRVCGGFLELEASSSYHQCLLVHPV
jgi:hypothetical protein